MRAGRRAGRYARFRLTLAYKPPDYRNLFYRYTSPVTDSLSQVKIGSLPQTSLPMARMKLQELKLIRSEGRCPASELKDEKKRLLEESQKPKGAVLTAEELVELYLTERIEDRKSTDGKIIPGARKKNSAALLLS